MSDCEIFISYRRQGGEFLGKLLHDRLEQCGYKVFYDVEDMNAGLFNRQIMDAIKQAGDVVLVLSANALDRCSNEDDWVRQEIEWAVRCGKNIIPVMTRDFVWPENLPKTLARLPYYHGIIIQNDNFDGAFQKLCSLFVCGTPSGADRAFAPESEPAVKKADSETEFKEYYPVKTPVIGYFKSNSRRTFCGNEMALEASASKHWQQKDYISGKFQTYGDMYGMLRYDQIRHDMPWFPKNEGLINELRKKCLRLLDYTYAGRTGHKIHDLEFYTEFVKFGLELWLRQRQRRDLRCMLSANVYFDTVLSYIFDWDYYEIVKAYESARKSHAQYFAQYLFAVIEQWPGQINLNGLKTYYREDGDYSSFAIKLLDAMIDMYTLIFDCWPDAAEEKFVKTKLLCNYKYLKKQHIFLPKEVQKKFSML